MERSAIDFTGTVYIIVSMDILSLSMQMSQTAVQSQAAVSILKSSINMTKANGNDIANLINSTRAPLADQTGTQVDLYA